MASWSEFADAAPELANVATRLWPGSWPWTEARFSPPPSCFSIAFLASVRRDGGPRVHPFCPILARGRLFAAIPRSSPKGSDLRRDPRCVIHALPGPADDEFCVRAIAREVTEPATRVLVRDVVARSEVGGMIESASREPLFEFDLEQVDVARWLDVGQPGTRAVRQQWRSNPATARPAR